MLNEPSPDGIMILFVTEMRFQEGYYGVTNANRSASIELTEKINWKFVKFVWSRTRDIPINVSTCAFSRDSLSCLLSTNDSARFLHVGYCRDQ